MAIEVGTNSYNTVAELTAYCDLRGISLSNDEEVLLHKSMDWIENQNYKYNKYSPSQDLEFPRDEYDHYKGDEINTVPSDIKKAQLVLCVIIDSGEDVNPIVGRATKKEKVDVIEVEYMDNAADTNYYPEVMNLIRRHLQTSSITVRV